jgi:AcrR family transcriptional regulator
MARLRVVPDLWASSLEAHRDLVRQRLLTAFAELAAEVPLDDITLTAVAERAGLARSAVYNYVTSKHDLLLEHTAGVTTRWVDRLARDGDGTVAERLSRFVAATLRVFAEDRLAGHGPDMQLDAAQHERLMVALQPVRDHLSALLAEGVADGTFAGDTGELTTFVFATLDGYRANIARGVADPQAAAVTVTDLLLDGLRGPR